MTARRWALLVVVAAALLLLVGRALAGVYVDYRWYAALGAASLWRTRTLLSVAIYLASGGAAALFVFANLYAVRHSVVSIILPRRVANVEVGQEVPGRHLVAAAAVISLIAGALLTMPHDSWMSFALSRHGVPFGEADPYFEADLGFFVYWLPFENALYTWALIAVLLVVVLVVFLYALTPSMRWERGSLYVSNWVRRHLVVLGSLLLLLLAWDERLGAYRVMVHGSGAGGAFTFSDHHAAIPVGVWLSLITIGAASAILFFGWTGQLRVAFVALSALLLLSFGLRQLSPLVVRRALDVDDAARHEQAYRQLRADYSRRAFALDRVETGGVRGFATGTDAVGAVAVWDAGTLARAISAVDPVKGASHGVAWLASSPALQAVVITEPSVRSEDGAPMPRSPRWRVTRILASDADSRGYPVITPEIVDGGDAAEDTLPPVLVHDSVPGYTVVSDPRGQIAAPGLGGGFSRLAHAWGLQNFRLLSGDMARSQMRVVSRRGVRDRVRALVPFFAQGTTVHPVVAMDSLYWVVDLYATSEFYPLSEHIMLGQRDFSYTRYAGMAVVNSHTGVVHIVPESAPGPIVESWRRIFPTLFRSTASLPAEVNAAIPPATDGARVQAEVLARYGMRGEQQRMGHLPWNEGADSVLRGDDAVPFELSRGTLAWSQPVLDSADRVAGLIVRTAGQNAATHWIALDSTASRWNLLLEQLHRAIDSSATPPADTRLVRGAVRAVPLPGGVALIQPAYWWKVGTPPTLARIGVVRDSIATTGESLAAALGVVSAPPSPVRPGTAGTGDLRTRVRRLYETMRDALRRGDWSAFGRAYDALGELSAPPER